MLKRPVQKTGLGFSYWEQHQASPTLALLRSALPPGAHLDVSTAGHLAEVLVQLQRLVHLVISHAVAAQASLSCLVHLGEDDKLGHVRDGHQLAVQQVGEGHRLSGARTVCQPEPGPSGRTDRAESCSPSSADSNQTWVNKINMKNIIFKLSSGTFSLLIVIIDNHLLLMSETNKVTDPIFLP